MASEVKLIEYRRLSDILQAEAKAYSSALPHHGHPRLSQSVHHGCMGGLARAVDLLDADTDTAITSRQATGEADYRTQFAVPALNTRCGWECSWTIIWSGGCSGGANTAQEAPRRSFDLGFEVCPARP